MSPVATRLSCPAVTKPRLRLEPTEPSHGARPARELTELEAFVATRMLLQDGDGEYDRIGCITLTVRSGPGAGTTQTFTGARVVGGRGSASDLILSDSAASHSHFELRMGAEAVTLRDLGSTNGTWLGPVRVREVIVPVGTTFTVGETDIELSDISRMRVPASRVDQFGSLRGQCGTMRELFTALSRVAATDLDFLIQGEPGTGKKSALASVHRASRRATSPLLIYDCGEEPNPSEVEKVLWGGPSSGDGGLLARAAGGTLALLRVEDLPVRLQSRLRIAIETREEARQMSEEPPRHDTRLALVSSADLGALVAAGLFHEGLYQRLADLSIRIPPLRERSGDVVFLFEHAWVDLVPTSRLELAPDAARALTLYPFPGNVTELLGVAARTAERVNGGRVTRRDLRLGSSTSRTGGSSKLPFREARDQFSAQYFSSLLAETGGDLGRAAEIAGVSIATVRRAIQK